MKFKHFTILGKNKALFYLYENKKTTKITWIKSNKSFCNYVENIIYTPKFMDKNFYHELQHIKDKNLIIKFEDFKQFIFETLGGIPALIIYLMVVLMLPDGATKVLLMVYGMLFVFIAAIDNLFELRAKIFAHYKFKKGD